MSRSIMIGSVRKFRLSAAVALCLCIVVRAEDERPQPPVEVYDWSVWVGSPAQETLNSTRTYRNAMPSVVGTSRPKLEGKELEEKFPIAPISVVQFFGDPTKDIDFDLRVKKGLSLIHI